MAFKIKIWHLLLFLSLLILIINFTHIIHLFQLLISYIIFLTGSYKSAIVHLNFPLADNLISIILFIALPVIAVKLRNSKILNAALSPDILVLLLLAYLFIFAPLIVPGNPDFQKDLRVTKLLPPLSTVNTIHLKNNKSEKNSFFELRRRVIQNSFDERIIFADSIKAADSLIYYQKERSFGVNKASVSSIGKEHFLLGTDEYGRDVLIRLVYGARMSLFIGFGAVCITFLFGILLGFAAGYIGGFADTILSRVSDMLLAFPVIFFIILILALFGNSLLVVIFVLGYSGWMSLFKIVRGEVISVKQKEYFLSAKLSGLPWNRLLFKEVFPVILAPVTVNLVLQFGNVILAESALSYLGLGTGTFYPSWGSMIESGQEYLSQAWWLIMFPGTALLITLFTVNSIGKKINFYFNPRLTNDK